MGNSSCSSKVSVRDILDITKDTLVAVDLGDNGKYAWGKLGFDLKSKKWRAEYYHQGETRTVSTKGVDIIDDNIIRINKSNLFYDLASIKVCRKCKACLPTEVELQQHEKSLKNMIDVSKTEGVFRMMKVKDNVDGFPHVAYLCINAFTETDSEGSRRATIIDTPDYESSNEDDHDNTWLVSYAIDEKQQHYKVKGEHIKLDVGHRRVEPKEIPYLSHSPGKPYLSNEKLIALLRTFH